MTARSSITSLSLVLLLLLCLSFSKGWSAPDSGAVNYDVEFTGIKDRPLLKVLRKASQLITLEDRPTYSVVALMRRTRNDLVLMRKILHSAGYYKANIYPQFSRGKGDRIAVVIDFDLGPLFSLAAFDIDIVDRQEPPIPISLPITLGQPMSGARIVQMSEKIVRDYRKNGFPYVYADTPVVRVDRIENTIAVAIPLHPGSRVRFGTTKVVGLKRLKQRYVDRRTYWKRGHWYDPDPIAETRKELLDSGLLATAYIDFPHEAEEGQEIPLEIHLEEAKRRTIGFGVGYGTHNGFGVNGEWENRNFTGLGDSLSIDADVSVKEQRGRIVYQRPDFRSRNQVLNLEGLYEFRETEGFDVQTLRVTTALIRKLSEKETLFYGLRYTHHHVTDSFADGDYSLASIPLSYQIIATDDREEPTRGQAFTYHLAPYKGLEKENLTFVRNQARVTYFHQIGTPHRKVVLSLSALAGSLYGAERIEIPPPELYYGGSETTLRGYEFLTVSPLIGTKPTGGRSILVYTVGLKIPFTRIPALSFIPSYQQGNVWEDVLPQFTRKLRQSISIGAAYATPVGPLSVSIGFPLNRRPGVDSDFQFYATIGNTF